MTVLFAVKVSPGLVVWETPEAYGRLLSGVDVEAAWAHNAPLEYGVCPCEALCTCPDSLEAK